MGKRALLGHPRSGQTRALATSPQSHRMLVVDEFAGGTAVWTRREPRLLPGEEQGFVATRPRVLNGRSGSGDLPRAWAPPGDSGESWRA